MTHIANIALIACDWGTSNRRAFALDIQGAVIAEKSDNQGMLALKPHEFDASFRLFAGEWLAHSPPVIICGMAGSRMGWSEAPYLPCPADPAGLAGALKRAPGDLNVHLVPGVCVEGPEPDVMRGEETKVLGLGLREGVVLSPGTHPKWIFVREGRISGFRTYMTGEVFQALQAMGTISQLAVDGPHDEAAFSEGVARGRLSPDLLHALFGVRTRALFNRLKPEQVKSFLSGLLIGMEMADALREMPGLASVTAIGSASLVHHYSSAARQFGLEILPIAAELLVPAALWRIACDAGLVIAKD